MTMRDLWVDHVFWVRNVVMASAAKNKKAQAEAEKQVVENAKRIANALLACRALNFPQEWSDLFARSSWPAIHPCDCEISIETNHRRKA